QPCCRLEEPRANAATSVLGNSSSGGLVKIHEHPFAHAACEVLRVPIRQPYTSVRCRLADFGRLRRTVPSVALLVAFYPHRADGVVRPRGDVETFVCFDPLEVVLRQIGIEWISCDFGNLE